METLQRPVWVEGSEWADLTVGSFHHLLLLSRALRSAYTLFGSAGDLLLVFFPVAQFLCPFRAGPLPFSLSLFKLCQDCAAHPLADCTIVVEDDAWKGILL